ncbi:hypothetical protein DVU_2262 [Nitratidesulfovibrio vulgaris str. Hildenborough]|uniref:Uncharacterized protein n=1 Tax=Nitratidesulfovibrio vulgaris (strain ATCC 29579 / DSM 644 / CCUG 34227 / NCIMB 8303 / VKM B-1760 / Hildenborough) TaxID=882 RepID=Q729T7_NITV2|nr:hypothetical protein DVU_2262 [Nitratidesulfovibrio vulgaris str. Hildenborough]
MQWHAPTFLSLENLDNNMKGTGEPDRRVGSRERTEENGRYTF